ncbi:Uncharacterised protein [Mycobacteroides abscessus subsp. abscessus]|nr:Uncharacterised protein [Mycobacteroides abscessus subsp. abscessus]
MVNSAVTSTAVSAITRSPPAATARCHATSTSSRRDSTERPAPALAACVTGVMVSGSPACSATAVSSSTDPANQNGAVGSPSSLAARVRSASRSDASRRAPGVGNTATSSSPASACTTSAPRSAAGDCTTTTCGVCRSIRVRSAAAPVGAGTAVARVPSRWKDSTSSLLSSPVPSTRTVVRSTKSPTSPVAPLAPSANLPSTQPDVDVAPPPALPRLDRAHHGMARATVVLVGVLVRTGITTADLSAGQTHPKVRPRILPKCRTVTTAAGRLRLRFRLADGVGEVRAGGRGIFFTRTRCP